MIYPVALIQAARNRGSKCTLPREDLFVTQTPATKELKIGPWRQQSWKSNPHHFGLRRRRRANVYYLQKRISSTFSETLLLLNCGLSPV